MKVGLAVLMKSFHWSKENLYSDFTEIKVRCGGLWEYLTVIRNDRGGGEVGEERDENGEWGGLREEKREGRGGKEKM